MALFLDGFYTYILLKESVDSQAFARKLPDYAERYLGEKMRELKMFYTFSLQPLAKIHLHSDLRYEIQATSSISTVYIFATIGAFILLIACINYMNLATARSLSRAKEVGVKKVLGAVKSQLIRQFLVEATVVATIALALALILMELVQPLFFNLTGKSIDDPFSNELLALLWATTVLVGLLSGIYPAFFISAFGASHMLKGSFKSSSAGIFLHKGLVVLQFAIAIILLVGIGVVKDFHFNSLQEAIAPVALYLTHPHAFSRISVRVNTVQIAGTIKFIEQAWRKHFPGALLQYSFMDERLHRQYQAEELFGKIFMTFVVLSLAIACLGLFGLAAFAAEQRTKEIGIRKVLGASLAGIAALPSKDFVKLVLCANILAWPLAYFAMNRWLQNFAYRIDIGWWIFGLAGGSALLIALLTVSTQALKAALANPIESLRYE